MTGFVNMVTTLRKHFAMSTRVCDRDRKNVFADGKLEPDTTPDASGSEESKYLSTLHRDQRIRCRNTVTCLTDDTAAFMTVEGQTRFRTVQQIPCRDVECARRRVLTDGMSMPPRIDNDQRRTPSPNEL